MKITLYSTPTCIYCAMTKKFFDENSISYTNIDVSSDFQSAQDMFEKTGQMGVPVIVINQDNDEKVIVGFDKTALKKILRI